MAQKTNVVRIFDSHKLRYEFAQVDITPPFTAEDMALAMGLDPASVFKTLVTVAAKSRRNYVFMVPANAELDLKKAAAAVGEKALEMLKQKELLPLTGYIHGGCSPVGMKKAFPTVIDESANGFEIITFSAGKIGMQVRTSLSELSKVLDFSLADIVVK